MEIARDGALVHMRDSKDPDGPILTFTAEEWIAVLADLRSGDLSTV